MKPSSFRSKLNRSIHKAARVTIWCEAMRQSQEVARIKAKAEAFIENNPQPRAVYLIG